MTDEHDWPGAMPYTLRQRYDALLTQTHIDGDFPDSPEVASLYDEYLSACHAAGVVPLDRGLLEAFIELGLDGPPPERTRARAD